MAGVIACIASARLGCKVALIQDRPVLGGNSSSEIRVPIAGADYNGKNRYAIETGIIEELRLEYGYRNLKESYPNVGYFTMGGGSIKNLRSTYF